MTKEESNLANLLVVAAIEEYGRKHRMASSAVFDLFEKYRLIPMIHSQYEVLHMLDFNEAAIFAEDVLKRCRYEETNRLPRNSL